MTSLPARRAFAAGLGVAALTATLVAGATAAGAAPNKPRPNGPAPVNLQLLAINDFHGQLTPPTGSSSRCRLPGYRRPAVARFGGGEYLATQIKQLEARPSRRTRSPSPRVTSSAPPR